MFNLPLKSKSSFFLATALGVSAAIAAPPPDANPVYKDYYEALKRDSDDVGCCSIADCRQVQVRRENGKWFAFVSKELFGSTAPDDWLEVPEGVRASSRKEGAIRPYGASLCWYASSIRCFDKPDWGG